MSRFQHLSFNPPNGDQAMMEGQRRVRQVETLRRKDRVMTRKDMPATRTAMKPIWLFALVTLTPIPLIGGAAVWGGLWVWAALGYLIVLTAVLDKAITWVIPATPGEDFPVASALNVALGVLHFGLLALTVWGLANSDATLASKAGTYLAAGLFFGQVSNANAHELIHRTQRVQRTLGMWVYISLLFGHHTSAHPLVHHVHVATRKDPSTARLGEPFYRFAVRAWRGSFRRGWEQESLRRLRTNRPKWSHPYVLYLGGAALCMGGAFVVGGWLGLAVYLGIATMAQTQLLMSDYVQHYGLTRQNADGTVDAIGNRHSWNSPHVVTSALTLNAPRHSDHHSRPHKGYTALTLPQDGPMLPHSWPIMAFVALYPRRWRQIMDPLAAHWTQDQSPDATAQRISARP